MKPRTRPEPPAAALALGALPAATLLVGACSGSKGSNQDPETLEMGEALYTSNCQPCHGDSNGVGRRPPASTHGSQGHTWQHADAQLLEITTEGTRALRESLGLSPRELEMPSFRDRLTRDEMLAVLGYIKSWWTEEQRKSQAQVSREWEEAIGP